MSVSPNEILRYLQQEAGRPLKIRELAKALHVPNQEYRSFRRTVRDLEREGAIVRLRNNRYGPPEVLNLVVGRLSVNPDGFGFVARETGDAADIFVGASGLGSALHGDRVVVRVTHRGTARHQPEGELVRVLERALKSAVGTYRSDGRFASVVPDDPRLTRDVYIAPEDAGGAQEGQKVVVRIDAWPAGRLNPEGHVVEILGYPDDPGIDILSIIKEYGLPLDFPDHVQTAVEALSEGIPEAECDRRMDLRHLSCVTIDPEDARDYDDAVSLETLEDGVCRLGVHIADVSFYVQEGTALDHEALIRGTSVYLPDRVIPMLPEALSNGLCSLRPGQDRLAISVLMRLTPDGDLLDHTVSESVICSHARLSYDEVQNLLEGKRQGVSPGAIRHSDMLNRMESLRRHLTERRLNRGAIDLEIPEAVVILDDDGVPTDIQRRKRLNSHRLIEEFMLLANQVVAGRMAQQGVPILYRVHDRPDQAKLAEFARVAAAFGHRFPKTNRIGPLDIQTFLNTLRGTREGTVLNERLLRSMKKAVYTPQNIGHFGLACDSYTHFTSPIRRYPDLLTHRLLREAASGRMSKERHAQLQERLPSVGDQATQREITAQKAEWDAVKLKQIHFLEDRIGERFDATIVGVRPIGFFVELAEYPIEGLVRVSSIEDDYYLYHETMDALIGERTGKTFRMGDAVVVDLVKADRRLRHIDFLLANRKAAGRDDNRRNRRSERRRRRQP